MQLPILVAGGGIGGLAAALALAAAGQQVILLERSAGPSGAGAGIQLGPNAVKMLRRLGVAGAVQAVASVPEALVVRTGATGRVLSRMQLGAEMEARHGAPYWVVHRADLQRVLWDAVRAHPGIALHTSCGVTGVKSQGSEGVAVVCADGSTLRGAALIGADGMWSRVREAVVPGREPLPSGYAAYRALIPATEVGTFSALEVGAWLSPSAHVVHYPVRGGRDINMVVIVRSAGPPATAEPAWSTPAGSAEIEAALAAFSPGLRQPLSAASAWQKWPLMEPIRLPRWTSGRVALLGDAAHAMLPFFAQGGAMALEDAVVLADCVARAPRDLALTFTQYAAQRWARVARVQAASSQNGRIFHLAGPAALARDAALRLLPPALLQKRFDWLYGFELADTI